MIVLIESEPTLQAFVLTRFLYANRYPPPIKSGAGFRPKTLYARARSLRTLISSTGRSGIAIRKVAPMVPSTR
jgi:hypothetical protein